MTEGELNNNLDECFKYQNLHNLFDYYNGECRFNAHDIYFQCVCDLHIIKSI